MSGLQNVLYGDDGRIRATLRVVPTIPLYVVTILIATIGFSAIGAPMQSMAVYAARLGVAALLFSGVFLLWSKRIDKRPLEDYGIETPRTFALNLLLGFIAVVASFAIWIGISTAIGSAELTLVMDYDGGSFAPAAILFALGALFGSVSQDLLYLGLITTNAIEGLRTRLSPTSTAVAGGVTLTAAVFVGYHFLLGSGVAGFLSPTEAAITLVTSVLFLVALYLYSGSLAMAVGAHAAFNAVQALVFVKEAVRGATPMATPTVFVIEGTLLPGALGAAPVAETVIASLLLFGSLRLVRGRTEVEETVSQFGLTGD